MAWYLNPALTRFRNEVNERWPRRDKTSDGTIGDAAHQATSSDHNPDADGSVDAWDMDVDGVDVAACIAAAVKHESIQYVIYSRKITSRSWGLGTWRDYLGANPHDKHVHFNTREGYENSDKPWFPEEDDVSAKDVWATTMTARETGVTARAESFLRSADVMRRVDIPRIELALAAILAAVQSDADRRAIMARIDERAAELRGAVALVDEAVVDQLAARTDDAIAAALRAALGADRAAAVGALLSAG